MFFPSSVYPLGAEESIKAKWESDSYLARRCQQIRKFLSRKLCSEIDVRYKAKNKGYKKHEISLDNKKLTYTPMNIVLFLAKMSGMPLFIFGYMLTTQSNLS